EPSGGIRTGRRGAGSILSQGGRDRNVRVGDLSRARHPGDSCAGYPACRGGQYASAEMTSPWARDPRAQMTCMFVVSLRNLTEPSQSTALAPAGWKLLMFIIPGFSTVLTPFVLQFGYFGFGGSRAVPKVKLMRPTAQFWPRATVLFPRFAVRSAPAHWRTHCWKGPAPAGIDVCGVLRTTPGGNCPRKTMSVVGVDTALLPLPTFHPPTARGLLVPSGT